MKARCCNLDAEGVLYVGKVRTGKTYCAVEDCIVTGGLVYSTIPIRHPRVENVVFESWEELMSYDPRCATLFIDDIGIWLNSHDWKENSRNTGKLREILIEHGHRHLRVIGTSQKVTQNDVMLRNVCQLVCVPRLFSIPLLGVFARESHRGKLLCPDHGQPINRKSRGDWPTFGTIVRKRYYDIDDVEMERNLAALSDDAKVESKTRVSVWDNKVANAYKSLALARELDQGYESTTAHTGRTSRGGQKSGGSKLSNSGAGNRTRGGLPASVAIWRRFCRQAVRAGRRQVRVWLGDVHACDSHEQVQRRD